MEDIKSIKLSVIEQLMHVRKESVLKRVRDILKKEAGLVEEKEALSLEEYNKRIDEAEQRVASGKFTTQEDLEKEVKEW